MPEVLSTASGRRLRAVLKTEGTVFPNTDRPKPADNVFCFFSSVKYFVSSFSVENGKLVWLCRVMYGYVWLCMVLYG